MKSHRVTIILRTLALTTLALGLSFILPPANSASWVTNGPLNHARYDHTATLLPNGLVLVAGGADSNNADLASAELYNVGLGFSTVWQPQITGFASPLFLGSNLVLTGSQFLGLSAGCGGNGSQDRPTTASTRRNEQC